MKILYSMMQCFYHGKKSRDDGYILCASQVKGEKCLLIQLKEEAENLLSKPKPSHAENYHYYLLDMISKFYPVEFFYTCFLNAEGQKVNSIKERTEKLEKWESYFIANATSKNSESDKVTEFLKDTLKKRIEMVDAICNKSLKNLALNEEVLEVIQSTQIYLFKVQHPQSAIKKSVDILGNRTFSDLRKHFAYEELLYDVAQGNRFRELEYIRGNNYAKNILQNIWEFIQRQTGAYVTEQQNTCHLGTESMLPAPSPSEPDLIEHQKAREKAGFSPSWMIPTPSPQPSSQADQVQTSFPVGADQGQNFLMNAD